MPYAVYAQALKTLCLVCASLLTATFVVSGRDLKVYFVDVEGGQATLVVAPSGESLLIDAGYAGFNNRDADRITEVARDAGVTKLDYLVITHYHADHAGAKPVTSAPVCSPAASSPVCKVSRSRCTSPDRSMRVRTWPRF
jgi:beta-lactamase superfamily II metal-dependent hydrolase